MTTALGGGGDDDGDGDSNPFEATLVHASIFALLCAASIKRSDVHVEGSARHEDGGETMYGYCTLLQ